MENNEEMRELEAEELMAKDELRHQHELEKIHVKGAEDRITESLKAENAKSLEDQKAENEFRQMIEEEIKRRDLEQEKIRVKAEEDRKTENLRHENVLAEENQRFKNQCKLERVKAGWKIVTVAVGGAIYLGFKSWCDTHDLSLKNIPNDIMK